MHTRFATTSSVNPRYDAWAEWMRRVFAIDVLECPRCHGPVKILAQIHPPETTRKILECLRWSTRLPPILPARSDPQVSLPIEFEPS